MGRSQQSAARLANNASAAPTASLKSKDQDKKKEIVSKTAMKLIAGRGSIRLTGVRRYLNERLLAMCDPEDAKKIQEEQEQELADKDTRKDYLRLGKDIYPVVRRNLEKFISEWITKALQYTAYARRDTLYEGDLKLAAEHMGVRMYGDAD